MTASRSTTIAAGVAAVSVLAGAAAASLIHQRTIQRLAFNPGFGMFNQGGFTHATRRVRGVVDIVFLDMDNFKAINTACGYQRSNQIVREAFGSLRTGVDGGVADIVLGQRFSGDEYVIVCPVVGDGPGLARRLLTNLANSRLSSSEFAHYEALTGGRTISATIALAPAVLVQRRADLEAALKRCEAAVSAQKEAGQRGGVVVL